jgi:hypothetical protein
MRQELAARSQRETGNLLELDRHDPLCDRADMQ